MCIYPVHNIMQLLHHILFTYNQRFVASDAQENQCKTILYGSDIKEGNVLPQDTAQACQHW